MRISSTTTIALAVVTLSVNAQTSNLVYNNTQVKVQSANQYSNADLIGYHVGAGLSYMVAGPSGSGNSFAFNLSATSAQLLDSDIAADYLLPCYVINTPQISNNSGPLECGAGDQTGYFDAASVTSPTDSSPGQITFSGISSWYVCAVQSFTYGWVQDTVVGAFGTGLPSGDGVQNCTTIDGLAFDIARNETSTSNTTATITSTSVTSSVSGTIMPPTTAVGLGSTSVSASSATSGPTVTASTGGSATYATSMTTVIVPCSSSSVALNATYSMQPMTSNPIASYANPSSPVATFTGAASTTRSKPLFGLVLAMAALVL